MNDELRMERQTAETAMEIKNKSASALKRRNIPAQGETLG